jgi:hypothetical protein
MSGASRVHCSDVPRAAEILSPEFLDFLVGLDDGLREHVLRVRAERAERIRRAVKDRILPASLPRSEAVMASWRVPPLPEALKLRASKSLARRL